MKSEAGARFSACRMTRNFWRKGSSSTSRSGLSGESGSSYSLSVEKSILGVFPVTTTRSSISRIRHRPFLLDWHLSHTRKSPEFWSIASSSFCVFSE